MSALLLRWHHGEWNPGIRNVIVLLFFLGFVYTPLISYVTARVEGMVAAKRAAPGSATSAGSLPVSELLPCSTTASRSAN